MKEDRIHTLARDIYDLPALPTLPHESFRDASALIEELVTEVLATDGNLLPDFQFLRMLIYELRRKGEPSAGERIAARCVEVFELRGENADAAYMCNIASACCYDQGIPSESERYMERGPNLLPAADPRCFRPTFLSNYSITLMELGRFDDAVAMNRKALTELDSCPEGVYAKATGEDPEYLGGRINNNIAWTLMRQSKAQSGDVTTLTRAIEYLNSALSSNLHPRTRVVAQGNLVEALLMKGDTTGAEDLLAILESDIKQQELDSVLPELYRRKAQLCAAREDLPKAVYWSRKGMRSSLLAMNPKQELRIVEVFLEMLQDLLTKETDGIAVLKGAGASILNQLLALLRIKDTYTGGDHSRRVAALSRRMASLLARDGIRDDPWLRHVEYSALLHDVGKLLIPWSLLNRARPLTAKEWAQLRAHSLTGENMLKRLGLHELAVVVGEHHERPDGTGYPRGKRESTLAASIVAVADSFEAMTSPSRIYKKPRPRKDALAEVMSRAGTQFDSDVARLLRRAVSKGARR